jgi:hypothetical protein
MPRPALPHEPPPQKSDRLPLRSAKTLDVNHWGTFFAFGPRHPSCRMDRPTSPN